MGPQGGQAEATTSSELNQPKDRVNSLDANDHVYTDVNRDAPGSVNNKPRANIGVNNDGIYRDTRVNGDISDSDVNINVNKSHNNVAHRNVNKTNKPKGPSSRDKSKRANTNNQAQSNGSTTSNHVIHKLKCCYTNADQLLNKRGEFEVRVQNMSPHIIGVNEVKPKNMKNKLCSAEFNLDRVGEYDMFHKNIENEIGRGIILYVDKALEAKEVHMETGFEECVFAEIKLVGSDKLLIAMFYRSPNSTAENNENMRKLISEASQKGYSHTLFNGDFNYPDINWTSWHVTNPDSEESKFVQCLQDNFLQQHVNMPTRCRGSDRANVLDLIITNDDNVTDLEYQSPLGKSDHSVLVFQYNCYALLTDETKTIKLYNKANYSAISEDIGKVDWEKELTDIQDMNIMWNHFYDKIQEIEDRHIPKRKMKKKLS